MTDLRPHIRADLRAHLDDVAFMHAASESTRSRILRALVPPTIFAAWLVAVVWLAS